MPQSGGLECQLDIFSVLPHILCVSIIHVKFVGQPHAFFTQQFKLCVIQLFGAFAWRTERQQVTCADKESNFVQRTVMCIRDRFSAQSI